MEDLTGKTFGRWKVLEWKELRGKINYYSCNCECGTIRNVSSVDLKYGNSLSCGCFSREQTIKRNTGSTYNRKNIIGNKYGMLTVVKLLRSIFPGRLYYECVCDCGNKIEVLASRVTSGNTKSCGCKKEKSRNLNIVGKRFGKLMVKEFIGTFKFYSGKKASKFLCLCDCGNEIEGFGILLSSGLLKSCGCSRGRNKKIKP